MNINTYSVDNALGSEFRRVEFHVRDVVKHPIVLVPEHHGGKKSGVIVAEGCFEPQFLGWCKGTGENAEVIQTPGSQMNQMRIGSMHSSHIGKKLGLFLLPSQVLPMILMKALFHSGQTESGC